MSKPLVIASRESRLAMWQAMHVQSRLQAQNPDRDVQILGMTTRGDQILDRPLAAIGGKGLFIKELEVAMAEGRADLAGTDHADGFADQIKTGEAMQREVAFAGPVIGPVQTTVQRQNQGYGMLGHGMGRVGGDPYNAQAKALGGWQVDMVKAGRTQSNQLRTAVSQLLQHRGAQIVVDKRADHLVTVGKGCGIEAQSRRLKVQLDTLGSYRGGKTVAVVGLAAEQNRAQEIFLGVACRVVSFSCLTVLFTPYCVLLWPGG